MSSDKLGERVEGAKEERKREGKREIENEDSDIASGDLECLVDAAEEEGCLASIKYMFSRQGYLSHQRLYSHCFGYTGPILSFEKSNGLLYTLYEQSNPNVIALNLIEE